MLIIPAIDIIDGRCVRLYRGEYDSAVVYADDPVETAVSFERAGAKRIHLVDLDAARGDKKNNRDVLRRIRERVSVVLETGGGIRKDEDVRALIDLGIDRLILGTVFAVHPDILRVWTERFGRHFIAGIDARHGEVRTSGWTEGSGVRAEDLAVTAARNGALSIIYTDIEKDGTLSGPNMKETLRVAEVSGLPVILSGGVAGMEDIDAAFKERDKGIRGVITGKALYEGKISLPEALDAFQDSGEDMQEW